MYSIAFLVPIWAVLGPSVQCELPEKEAISIAKISLGVMRYPGPRSGLSASPMMLEGKPAWCVWGGPKLRPEFFFRLNGKTGAILGYSDSSTKPSVGKPVDPNRYAKALYKKLGPLGGSTGMTSRETGGVVTVDFPSVAADHPVLGLNGVEIAFERRTGRVLRLGVGQLSVPKGLVAKLSVDEAKKRAFPSPSSPKLVLEPKLAYAPLCRLEFSKYPTSSEVRLVWWFQTTHTSAYVDAVSGEVLNHAEPASHDRRHFSRQ